MRTFWALMHRWAGLSIAAFIFFSGVTGAVISWDHELDDLINPELMHARTEGPAMPALDLVRLIEQRNPEIRVTYFKVADEPGESFSIFAMPRVDPATGRLHEPGFNQVFVDPVTGKELGKRQWGAVWPITKENFVSFLYRLHYTMHIPELWGIDRWGMWLLGGVALLWTFDCFVGFYLTLPARRRATGPASSASDRPTGRLRGWWPRWAPAWKIRWKAGTARLTFDLHRAFSLWTWILLFTVAFTGFSLNLYREVFFPLMSKVSTVTPTPFDLRTPNPRHQPIEPGIDWHRGSPLAREEGGRRRGDARGDGIYAGRFAIYQARYYRAGDGHGAGGVGPTTLFIDGMNGQILGERLPWHGTVADIFVQAQFPLHSGRILGLPGRILISIMGIVAAMLSVTGVLIWWRRRRARLLVQPVARVATGTDTIERDSSPCDGSRPTLTLRSIPVRHLDRRLPRM